MEGREERRKEGRKVGRKEEKKAVASSESGHGAWPDETNLSL